MDDNRLSLLLEGENKTKRAAARKMTSRHSRFGTTVALQAVRFCSRLQRLTFGVGRQEVHPTQGIGGDGAERSGEDDGRGEASQGQEDPRRGMFSARPPNVADGLVGHAQRRVQSPTRGDQGARRRRDKVCRELLQSFVPLPLANELTRCTAFFSSILKDIRMERLKVKESDTIKFLFLSRFFLEFFLLVFEKNKGKGKAVEVVPEGEAENEPWDFGLIAIMTEPASIGFVTARMKMAMDEKVGGHILLRCTDHA